MDRRGWWATRGSRRTTRRRRLQADALTRAAVDVVFEEEASGANTARPVLAKTLAALRSGDTLVVWRLDRLGRSLGHLIEVATVLRERGVFLRSLTEGFDTSTASGRLLYHVLGAVAEFEREVIKERTVAGMKAAKKRGTHVGRPQALVGSRLAEAGRCSPPASRRSRQPASCGFLGRRSNVHTQVVAEGVKGQRPRPSLRQYSV